jgi:hypothetical protein
MGFVCAGGVVSLRVGMAVWPKLTENCLRVRRTELAQIQSGLAMISVPVLGLPSGKTATREPSGILRWWPVIVRREASADQPSASVGRGDQ